MGEGPVVSHVPIPYRWVGGGFGVVDGQGADVADDVFAVDELLADELLLLGAVVEVFELEESEGEGYDDYNGDNSKHEKNLKQIGRHFLLDLVDIFDEIFLTNIDS